MNRDGATTKAINHAYSRWLEKAFEVKSQTTRKKYLQDKATAEPQVKAIDTQRRLPRIGSASKFEQDDAQKKRLRAIAEEANFSNYSYNTNDNPMRPTINFYKWLNLSNCGVKFPGAFIADPTLDNATYLWMHCDESENIKFSVFSTSEQVLKKKKKILKSLCSTSTEGNQITAVLKVPDEHNGYLSNNTSPLKTFVDVQRKFIDIANDHPKNQVMIQQYIKPKGNKAWIVRSVWTPKHTFAWVFSDKDVSFTKSLDIESCTIVKSHGSQSWIEPKNLIENLVNSLKEKHHLRIQELAADFIQDSSGKWWMLQVKSFKISKMKKNRHQIKQCHSAATNRSSAYSKFSKSFDFKSSGTKCIGKFCNSDSLCDIRESNNQAIEGDDNLEFLSFKDMHVLNFVHDFVNNGVAALSFGSCDFRSALNSRLNSLSRKERNRLYDRITICLTCSSVYSTLRVEYNKLYQKESSSNDKMSSENKKDKVKKAYNRKLQPLLVVKDTITITNLSHDQSVEFIPSNRSEITTDNQVLDEDEILSDLRNLEKECNIEFQGINRIIRDPESTKFNPERNEGKIYEHTPTSISTFAFQDHESGMRMNNKNFEEKCDNEVHSKNVVVSVPHNAHTRVEKGHVSMKMNELSRQNNANDCLPTHIILVSSGEKIFYDEDYKLVLLEEGKEFINLFHRVKYIIPLKDCKESSLSMSEMILRTLSFDLNDLLQENQRSKLPDVYHDKEKNNMVLDIVPTSE